MGYALRMSGEIRDWLTGLCDSDPSAAMAVGQALVALADARPGLGPPAVVALDPPPPHADPAAALDCACQDRLERLQLIRRVAEDAARLGSRIRARIARLDASQSTAEAAELRSLLPGLDRDGRRLTEASRRLQVDVDAFRGRTQVLQARHAAAVAENAIARLFAAAAEDDDELARQQLTIAEGRERLAAIAAEIDRELGHEAWPDGLMELRAGAPGGPGGDVRVIFAIEPAGVALLISVLEGRDAILDQHRQAVAVSAGILRRVRSGQDREASAVEFAGSRQFADEFFPAAPTTPAGTGDASQARPPPGDVAVPPEAAGTGAMAPLTIPWLPFPLAREGRPPCEYRVRDAALVLTGAASTDLFVDPAGAGTAPDAGRLLGTPPPGDFTLAALVRVDFRATYDAGVLLLYAGERRWAKLCLELSPQRQPTAVTVVTRDTSDDCNSFEVTDRSLWLRITRAGAAWAFHASTDGDWWRLLRYFSLGSDEPVRVGFLAQSPTGQGCTATFEQIALRAGAPADLRDGS